MNRTVGSVLAEANISSSVAISTTDGAHIARRAHWIADFSSTRGCFFQFTRSFDENASKKVCSL
mgnify:CR=1 FL=1